jgi:uncharacterized protein YjbI with pentapeptide repeats
MQQPPSTMTLSEPENRYPDSLCLDLIATPASSGESDIEQINLSLRLDFHEQWYPINTGRVKFGFKGGRLNIQLVNGEMLPSRGQLSDVVQLSPKNPSQLQSIECQVLAQGTVQSPTWVWQGKTGMSVLQGSLKQTELGTVQVTGRPCSIETVFTVSPSDIYLTSAEGLWHHSITPNQLAVLERKLVLCLLETKLQPYLSRVLWQYDEHQGLQKLSQNPDNQKQGLDSPEMGKASELADLIQRVTTAQTDNFLELAQLAGLNPLTDFAGAKLLGVNLNGVDLSGANLHRSYLRGADLSDTDLSGTDLQGANLGGADLSGAYLSDADLSDADLHRASLALANLSGANLSGANLREANLSSANFSDANLTNANLSHADLHRASLMLANLTDATWLNSRVEEARFSRSSGLSEQWKQDLKQRGAIFED